MRRSYLLTLTAAILVACPIAAQAQVVRWSGRRSSSNAASERRAEEAERRKLEAELKKLQDAREKKKAAMAKEARKLSIAAIKEAYEKGKKAHSEKRYSAAHLHLSTVAACRLKEAAKMSAQAQTTVIEIEKMIKSKIAKADIMVMKGDPAEAAKLYMEVLQEFPFADVSEKADKGLRSLRSSPKVAAMLRYMQGKAYQDAEDYAAALRIYDEVVQRWPKELSALRAQIAAKKIRSDPEMKELAGEALELKAQRKCPTLLNMAKNFLINGDAKTARAKLNQVVSDHPGTTYAAHASAVIVAIENKKLDQAKAMLSGMPGERPATDSEK